MHGEQRLLTSLATALSLFLGAIPRIIGFLVILVIGWFISGLLAAAVAALVARREIQRSGPEFRSSADLYETWVCARMLLDCWPDIVKWFVRLIVLVVAFDALGLPAVSEVLQQFLLWIPNLVVAVVVLVIAGLAANALGNLVRGCNGAAGLGNPDLLGNHCTCGCLGLRHCCRCQSNWVAQTLVNTLFMGFIGALALAAGLAFGLGGRETAAQIVQGWYRQGREAKPKT